MIWHAVRPDVEIYRIGRVAVLLFSIDAAVWRNSESVLVTAILTLAFDPAVARAQYFFNLLENGLQLRAFFEIVHEDISSLITTEACAQELFDETDEILAGAFERGRRDAARALLTS